MELIHGETLADWLRARRSPRMVIEAFVAAGRGLAAAHPMSQGSCRLSRHD